MACIHLELASGGSARLLALAGDRVTGSADRPAVPGARLAARLADGRVLCIKVLASGREGEAFGFRGRLIDATRELRQQLARELDHPADEGKP